VSKVYYRVLPKEFVEAMGEGDRPAAMMMDGVPFYMVGRESDEITTVIDVGDYVEQKLQGIQCHATQVGRHNRFSEEVDEVIQDPLFREEHFLLAQSTAGWPEGVERDLFARLR
jgi:LmbE family N-acetylglucosaminyl deacetylase